MAGRPAAPSRSGHLAVDAIVVAAGDSRRMEGIDKRLALIGGRPLLVRTLEAIAAAAAVERIVLVMGPGAALEAIRAALPDAVVAVVPGGDHRGASVAAGLAALATLDGSAADPERVVLVHDGARPLVPAAVVAAVARAAADFGAAVPVVPVADTVRRAAPAGDDLGPIVERDGLLAAQTPQGARAGLLRAAFRRFPPDGTERFTDEAALLMACTIRVHPVPGDPVNLKVTLPADLARADAIFSARLEQRTGFGSDSHPFGPGDPLHLGGIAIAGAPRLHGHSDGDVALHAIADALLGAAALGDLGRLFPADARTPRGIAGPELLARVVARLAEAGWRPRSVDLTITGARPRLAAHLDAMRDAIAGLLHVPSSAVGVKASSGNLEGAACAGRVIEAAATVTIEGEARPHASASAGRSPATGSGSPS
ncbi:MAG: 2-C-methyl-D-erythritol 2,4-cyclodiphosphate synthase [Chloroflexi bacterium]|nr:2-C-methyl-D-erythritol 2,4-cyclodiphosphate synthase [Chloroflexota bacterium]